MSGAISNYPGIARIGDYLIEARISSGGMGVIYKARQISTRRTVALKVLRENLAGDASYLERFIAEVRLLARMEHPNMVRVYEGGTDGRFAYFSMELIRGDDLKMALDRGYRFSEAEAVSIAGQVASALTYAWRKEHMIHRDVKPANIMLKGDGTAVLLDLGISKQLSGNDVFLMNTGVMIGSPTYMSPEQASNGQNIDFRSDIYSLGITLFHLLAGHPPYEGKTPLDVLSQHLSAPLPDIRSSRRDISRHFSQILRRMMAKKKTERFDSWEDFKNELETIREADNERRKKITSRHFNPAYKRSSLRISLMITFLCLCLAGGLSLFYCFRPVGEKNAVRPETLRRKTPSTMSVTETPLPSASAEGPLRIRRDYLHFRNGLKKQLRNLCDDFLLHEQYAEGVRFFRDRSAFPAEVREGGVFESDFKKDRDIRNFLEGKAALFESLLEKQEKGLK